MPQKHEDRKETAAWEKQKQDEVAKQAKEDKWEADKGEADKGEADKAKDRRDD